MSLVQPTPISAGPSSSAPSASSSQKKLTKKQQKALAFRDRKSGGKKSKGGSGKDDDLAEMDVNAVPTMEDQDLAGLAGGEVEVGAVLDQAKDKERGKKGDKAAKGKGKHTDEDGRETMEVDAQLGKKANGGKKRKREEDSEEKGEGVVAMEVDGEGEKSVGAQPKKKKKAAKEGDERGEDDRKQRFILFVGNLQYTTPKEAIQKHFAACDPPPDVRLLTPKPKPGVAARPKSKGCAFLEFKTKASLQQALRLHQSMLDGRMINVELTAGGGGKSEARMSKVKARNKGLLSQRQKKVEAADKGKGRGNKQTQEILSRPDRPQRWSSTSGLEEAPTGKKTWTVGDVAEETHRGGQKHVRGKKKPKTQGTGVNAIPVG